MHRVKKIIWEKIELISGIAAGCLGLFFAIYFRNWPNNGYVFLFISGPAIFLAYGVVVHAIMRHNIGFVLVIPSGLILCISLVHNLNGGIILFGPFILPILGTSLLGILCLASAVLVWIRGRYSA